MVTTTPRPVPLVRRLLNGDAEVTRSATRDNQEHLAPSFTAQIEAAYAGTSLACQELNGELGDLAHECGASEIVAEANQGGEMLRTILESGGCARPVRLVHARLGKRARAMPVATLYARGLVSHVGAFAALEDEMCRFGSAGFVGSPGRVDALVWAVTILMLDRLGDPWIRAL